MHRTPIIKMHYALHDCMGCPLHLALLIMQSLLKKGSEIFYKTAMQWIWNWAIYVQCSILFLSKVCICLMQQFHHELFIMFKQREVIQCTELVICWNHTSEVNQRKSHDVSYKLQKVSYLRQHKHWYIVQGTVNLTSYQNDIHLVF